MKVDTKTPGVIIIQNKNGANAAQWITAACSVTTLVVVSFAASELLDKADQVNTVVQNVKNPMKSIRSRFAKKEK